MIAILGSGAMGSVFGGKLAEAGEDVVLIDPWREHVEEINDRGLGIEGVGGTRRIRIKAVTSPQQVEDEVKLIIVFVKSQQTETAVKGAAQIIEDDTLVMTLQNGLGNAETIAKIVGVERTMAGVTANGATLLGPGNVRHVALGDTTIGSLSGKITNIEEIAHILTKAGLPTKLSDDVREEIWGKLIVNVGINALTAVLRVPNGYLVEHKSTEKLLEMAVKEAMEVSRAEGIELKDDPLVHCKMVAENTAKNLSSMYQDVTNRRRTEIDYINGAIARGGKKYGIKTPVNEILVKLVKAIEEGY